MPNDYFRFKQFTVRQDRCALKVGTDGVLLGAWTKYDNALRILDIGAGTGLLGLIAAQRNTRAMIDAVEIDAASAEQARENALASPWAERIHVFHADVRLWEPSHAYDLILCNPPFYKGHHPSHEVRTATAKHDLELSLAQLMQVADRACNAHGHLSMIIPIDRLEELKALSVGNGFVLSRQCSVSYLSGKMPKRVLVGFSRHPGPGLMSEAIVVEQHPGEFTPEYKALLRDLVLHF